MEEVDSPEESLWRGVLLRYAGDVFKLKLEMIEAKEKYIKARENKDAALVRFKNTCEHYEFHMYKLKSELSPRIVEEEEILPLRIVCELANLSFSKFKGEMLKIINDKKAVPEGGKRYMSKV